MIPLDITASFAATATARGEVCLETLEDRHGKAQYHEKLDHSVRLRPPGGDRLSRRGTGTSQG